MSWLASLIVGVLTAAIAAVATGVVANLAVDWYKVPNREGASGYFVLAFILLALALGLIIGIVMSRLVAGQPDPGFLKAMGWSQLIMLSVIGIAGITARLVADVPPTLDGQPLLLNVEFRWPANVELPTLPGEWSMRLGALSGRTQRLSESGPLWKEDARQEDGRWIVPGAVQLYTSRGERLISADPEGVLPIGFLAPVPSYPRRRALEWSDWLPKLRPGSAPRPDAVSYRWRVVPANQTVRRETIGPFTVETRAQSFSTTSGDDRPATWSARATFTIRYRDQPITIEGTVPGEDSVSHFTVASAVAVVGSAPSALLVETDASQGSGHTWLLTADGDRVKTQYVSYVSVWLSAPPLTSDTAIYSAALANRPVEGRVDRASFAQPLVYLFDGATLDAGALTVHRFGTQGEGDMLDRIPPLAVSPDGQSFVRVRSNITGGYSNGYLLAVINMRTGATDTVPIDAVAMRFKDIDQLSPVYVSHYFTWTRDDGGTYRLLPRTGVDPLPYRGVLSYVGGTREYRVGPAQPGLLEPMVDLVLREFKGERLPAEQYSSSVRVKVGADTVNLMFSDGSDAHVGIWMDQGVDAGLMEPIAQRLDAALATGKYDALFVTAKSP